MVKRIVIAGGGTAGWMAAASLSHQLRHLHLDITLVESNEIGTIGVGEATVPAIRDYLRAIDLDMKVVLREALGTVKLGIQFVDWREIGQSFFHPFGVYGVPAGDLGFHHLWHRLTELGDDAPLSDYNLCTQMALNSRFAAPTTRPRAAFEVYDWAVHFDAGLFADVLRRKAKAAGVRRLEGLIDKVEVGETGEIRSLTLKTGDVVEGDLFIDCTGFRAVLTQQTLRTGFEDWTQWLPCDRAVAIPSTTTKPFVPYTRATAQAEGWMWRIPLQHRVGNGYVYSSRFATPDMAEEKLRGSLEGEALSTANHIRFTTGHSRRFWNGNCVALGLAAGFLEPLESTSLVLVQTGIEKLIRLFPQGGIQPAVVDEYNRTSRLEYERIRDFILLHYWASRREEPFWRAFKELNLPATLQQKIDVFREVGHLIRYEWESFQDSSWLSMYAGFAMTSKFRDPGADALDAAELLEIAKRIRSDVAQLARDAPLVRAR